MIKTSLKGQWLINRAATVKATFSILLAIKQGKSFVPELHDLLVQESEEYRNGYVWAVDVAKRNNLSSGDLRLAAYRYAGIEGLAARGIMYGFREMANRRVEA